MEEKQIGPYHLLCCLGKGGMGTVYLAQDKQLQRQVAVKVIAPELIDDPDLMARFRIEAIAQARLNHPNIITIHAFSQTDGICTIVMEYVAGKTLKQLIQEQGRLRPESAISITIAVLEALAFAHSKGILHRDIKPANIILTPDGTVKLGDFGIAKIEGLDGLTRIGTMLGTPHYSSPEQIMGMKAGPASDIYSMTITLFEMLTGALPFGTRSSSNLEIQKAHLEKTPPVLSSILPGVSSRLDALIARGLAKKPEDRFKSPQEFTTALKSLLNRRQTPHRLFPIDSFFQGLRHMAAKPGNPLKRPRINPPSLNELKDKRWLLLLLIPLLLLLLFLMAVAAQATPLKPFVR